MNQTFQKRILSPLGVAPISLLAESGWRGERVLQVTVEAMNGLKNAPIASSPTPGIVPEYEGFLEAIRLMRKLESSRTIPTVVVTAKGITEEDRRRLDGGVAGLLEKRGLDRESLLAQLREQVAASKVHGTRESRTLRGSSASASSRNRSSPRGSVDAAGNQVRRRMLD